MPQVKQSHHLKPSGIRNLYRNRILVCSAGLICLIINSPGHAQPVAGDPPLCRGAYFQSPFDHQINASLLVKRGEACTVKIRIPDGKDITVIRPPKRGKVEPVPDNLAVVYTPNTITGRDRFSLNSIRRQGEKSEIKQTIFVEVEILSQADYPFNFLMTEPAPPPAPENTEDKQGADKKPPAK